MGFLTKIVLKLRRSGKEGQHTIEYAILMILIMAGIITMGRYVIRSWNANLKGLEDSVIDSFEDPLLEAPIPPASGGSCTVSGWTQQGCGLGIVDYCSGDSVSCAETELASIRSFDPPGCQCNVSYSGSTNTIQCSSDPCCCETPIPTGLCGNDMNLTGPAIPACSGITISPLNPDGTCPDDYMGYSTRCGSDGSLRYGCLENLLCLGVCPTALLDVTDVAGEMLGSFTEIANGETRIITCPLIPCGPTGPYGIGVTCSAISGSPRRLCTDGIWQALQQPCVYTSACIIDGLCDASAGEDCNNCPSDCGSPDPYGVCP